jgi:hypothetical protein
MTGRSGGGRRFGEQGTTHCDPVRGRGRWHVGQCGDRGPAWEEKKQAGPKKNSNFFYLFKKVLKELNGFHQKRSFLILKKFK